MKKVLYLLLVIILLLVIAIETPIFIKYYQREYAIEIMRKAQSHLNYEITRNYVLDNKIHSETIKYLNNVARIQEVAVDGKKTSITWCSTNKNISYYIDLESNLCFPYYDGNLNQFLQINGNEIEGLRNNNLKDLKFKKINYDSRECLEIKETSGKRRTTTIIDIETGFLLKYYSENGNENETEINYDVKINELTEKEMKPNLEKYNIIITVDEITPSVDCIKDDENLPQSVIDDFESKYSDNN